MKILGPGPTIDRLWVPRPDRLVVGYWNRVALHRFDGSLLWEGSARSPICRNGRMVVFGQEVLLIDLEDGKVLDRAPSPEGFSEGAFDGTRVAWAIYWPPVDWGEIEMWIPGSPPQQFAKEVCRTHGLAFVGEELWHKGWDGIGRFDLAGNYLGKADGKMPLEDPEPTNVRANADGSVDLIEI